MKAVIGVIYNNRKNIEAVKIYDTDKKVAELRSLRRVQQMLESKEKIIGVELKQRISYEREELEYINYVQFNKAYNIQKISKLNGKGEVIEPGTEIILGKDKSDPSRYIVIDGNCNIRYVSKKEALEQKLLGVRGDRCIMSSDLIDLVGDDI